MACARTHVDVHARMRGTARRNTELVSTISIDTYNNSLTHQQIHSCAHIHTRAHSMISHQFLARSRTATQCYHVHVSLSAGGACSDRRAGVWCVPQANHLVAHSAWQPQQGGECCVLAGTTTTKLTSLYATCPRTCDTSCGASESTSSQT
jgi:hypothetical protein